MFISPENLPKVELERFCVEPFNYKIPQGLLYEKMSKINDRVIIILT